MNRIVIFDIEMTTWEGAMSRDWTGPGETREIIQIGALKVDWPSGEVVDTIDLIVKPKINPQVSEYCRQLTGITQQRIELEGIDFATALERFITFCGPRKALSFGADFIVLGENIGFNRCPSQGIFSGGNAPHFIDISFAFAAADPSIVGKGINSGRLWQHYGLEKPQGSGEHDGLFDCRSILAAMRHLHGVGKNIADAL